MARTNRDHIRRRVLLALAIGAAGWLTIFAASFINHAAGEKGPQPLISAIGFLMFIGAILAVQRVKCPRCATRLGQVAMLIGAQWGKKRRLNFCPYCGTSLDDSMKKDEPVTRPAAAHPMDPIR